jgi:2C-methyl-D-erythritol 2,4-cyclodiphosphate synthase
MAITRLRVSLKPSFAGLSAYARRGHSSSDVALHAESARSSAAESGDVGRCTSGGAAGRMSVNKHGAKVKRLSRSRTLWSV